MYMFRKEKIVLSEYLGDMVYGANDGIITTFAIISAGAGATFEGNMIIVIGLANLIADGFSMGASSFLSIKTREDVKNRKRLFGTYDGDARRRSLATFLAFILAGSMPLIPFFCSGVEGKEFLVSAVAAGVAFFTVGGLRTLVTKRGFIVSGLEILFVGGVAAGLSYSIGAIVEAVVL